ncbi:hypothetical protein KUG88_29360 [Rhodococcus rhodochrous]|uniref:hypothetical protein n=1 Tax=Rhodococcus rhodochrous TaxID=1829 RepID=UPI001E63F805|nr:hypothetical protein [Rhodococcus rhodochrous]MCB8914202.1 hypothetical protein [Rhodococcus rhodochrous]
MSSVDATRNIIQNHGTTRATVRIPLALAEATNLSMRTIGIAALMYSFDEDETLSVGLLADHRKGDGGKCSRNTIERALRELEAAGWLVRQPYATPGKKPYRYIWHLQRGPAPFTPEQIRELSTPVVAPK